MLIDLNYEFANSFQYYLQAEKGLSINSSGKMIKNLKKVIRDCVDKNWTERDPFWNYRIKHIDPKIPFLTMEELQDTLSIPISQIKEYIPRCVPCIGCRTRSFVYLKKKF